ncbi:hypothetical protein D3C72_1695120 [compost metagenome]
MHDPWPVMTLDQAPEIIHLTFTGTGLRPENLPKTFHQPVSTEGTTDHPAQRAEQEFLHQHRTMGFRKQATIEKHATGQLPMRLVMPRQQFLGHAVAVVVSQQVHRLLDTQVSEQRLLQISLLQQAVLMIGRFVRIAEAEHVAGNHAITLGQWLPQVMPVPTGGRKAVDEQQRVTLPCRPVMDAMTTEHERLAALAPDTQGDLGECH